ncbi:hypothetical protein M378DRAFT_677784 [Amanita muscaria Koide BX008]|uniref:Uncharacterized protein n=1 Tax=Amanita muscaria (strain Koide BX008) TaxID=946122 RepID=A0A0C2RX25_AMAMK|nr:hypothetical protein M378DRAFT_677784 [Amanita muscaria Koide BX008]
METRGHPCDVAAQDRSLSLLSPVHDRDSCPGYDAISSSSDECHLIFSFSLHVPSPSHSFSRSRVQEHRVVTLRVYLPVPPWNDR